MAAGGRNTQRALVACGAWLTVGFIGASVLAAGLLQLVDGDREWLSAPALAVSGGTLAIAGWCRSQSVLEQAKGVSAIATNSARDPGARALQAYRRRRDSPIASYPDASGPEAQ